MLMMDLTMRKLINKMNVNDEPINRCLFSRPELIFNGFSKIR